MTMIQNLIKNHMLDKLLSILRQVRDGRSADPFLLVLIIITKRPLWFTVAPMIVSIMITVSFEIYHVII